ncbi:hypothetical protein BD410DRAFT_864759 [Rickenella mellea]|uniref:Uncharacterized protein n=1 Tax=Rickenella mellea TaxID=50990 RepID=A0A4Y7Q454_9AGAM|nr:hypothetical protein BD410DRAFT_864759 [Rickenella mellea]
MQPVSPKFQVPQFYSPSSLAMDFIKNAVYTPVAAKRKYDVERDIKQIKKAIKEMRDMRLPETDVRLCTHVLSCPYSYDCRAVDELKSIENFSRTEQASFAKGLKVATASDRKQAQRAHDELKSSGAYGPPLQDQNIGRFWKGGYMRPGLRGAEGTFKANLKEIGRHLVRGEADKYQKLRSGVQIEYNRKGGISKPQKLQDAIARNPYTRNLEI